MTESRRRGEPGTGRGKLSRAWLPYGVLGAALDVGHLSVPEPAQSVVYIAVGLSAVAAVLLGVRRWRQGRSSSPASPTSSASGRLL